MMAGDPQQAGDLRILNVICLSTFLFFNSYGSINVAIPTIQGHFASSLAAVQWIAIIGLVMVSSLSLCFGRAGDLLGRKRLYRVGVAMYTLGSGLAALATSFPMLLSWRIVMTLGLSMAAPMSAGILATTYPSTRRGEVLGWLAATIAIGRATGPTVGGVVLQLWGWRAIFLANLIIGLAVSVAVFRVLGEREERRADRFDFLGAVTLMVGYPSFLIALSLGAQSGWSSAQIPIWLAVSLIGSIGFVVTESHIQKPLIQPALFRDLTLSTTVLSLALISAVYYPVFILAPLYMENVLSLSPLAVGFAATMLPVCAALTSPIGGRLADRGDSIQVAAVGMLLTLSGVAFYAHLGLASHYLSVIMALSLMGVGVGLFIPANQRSAFSTVGGEHYGIISALITSLAPASGTVGTAMAVALLEGTMTGKAVKDAVAFSNGQQFAFYVLLPLGVLAVVVCFLGSLKKTS